jgi:hypothetical protein
MFVSVVVRGRYADGMTRHWQEARPDFS